MFYVVFFVFSLFLSFATSAYFFEQRRNGKPISLKNKFSLGVVHALPFVCLSAFVIKSISVEDDIKVVLIALGSLLCLFVIIMAERHRFPPK